MERSIGKQTGADMAGREFGVFPAPGATHGNRIDRAQAACEIGASRGEKAGVGQISGQQVVCDNTQRLLARIVGNLLVSKCIADRVLRGAQ